MRILWRQPDGTVREVPFHPDEAPPEVYEAVEDLGRWPTFEAFVEAVFDGSRSAWRVALWVGLRLEQAPGETPLTLDEVQPRIGDLDLRYNPDQELAIARVSLANPKLPKAERNLFEAMLPELEAAAAAYLGKDLPASDPAPSPTSGGRGASSSRRRSTSPRQNRTA